MEKDLGSRLGADTAERVCEGSRCWFGVGRGESWRRIEVLIEVSASAKVTAGSWLGVATAVTTSGRLGLPRGECRRRTAGKELERLTRYSSFLC